MKKLIILMAFALAMSFFMSSCKDDESTTGPSDLKIGEMSASVGGSNWKAQNAYFYNTPGQVSGAQVELTNPINGTTKTISVNIANNSPEKKTYKAICFYQESTGMPPSTTVTTWNDANGSCEVTEVSATEIKGTFTFTGNSDKDGSTKKVTGSFYVQRQ